MDANIDEVYDDIYDWLVYCFSLPSFEGNSTVRLVRLF